MTNEHEADLVDKAPPQDAEAEQTILGAMMAWPGETIEAVLSCCEPADCFNPGHRLIFEAILAVDAQTGGVSDLGLLCAQLDGAGGLEKVGGREYLIELANSVATPATARYYAERIRECARLRTLQNAAVEVCRGVTNPGAKSGEVAETLEAALTAANGDGRHDADVMTAAQALAALDARDALPDRGLISTGLCDLDEYLAGGLRPGQMVVLAGKTSSGKTSLALGIARQAAIEKGVPVAIFSTEMPGEDLAARLVASVGDVDAERLRKKRLGPGEHNRVMLARASIAAAPLCFVEAAGLTIPKFRVRTRQLVRRYKVGLIVVDYLQQMTSGGAVETRQAEVAAISRAMQQTARELKIPVLVLSQLSRKADDLREPRISDLRASGTIEEDGDIVILIHRKANEPELAKIIIGKQRNGKTGHFTAAWSGSRLSFRNFTPRERQDAIDAAPEGEDRDAMEQRLTPHDDPGLPLPY